MKLSIPICPKCGERAIGSLEQLYGIATFSHFENGIVENSGSTDINWNGQRTVTDDKTGDPILVCINGHEWPSKIIE